MFKRTNKLTALLVAAAAVVAVVPTTANAATRLEAKEGNITSGYSYAEGKYVYDGYLTDDDDAALYFTDGEKDAEEVEDYDDYDYNELNGSISHKSNVIQGDNFIKERIELDDLVRKLAYYANISEEEFIKLS